MSIVTETQQLRDLFAEIEVIEEVAETLPRNDDRRLRLLSLAEKRLAGALPVRPAVAGELLELTEKTVRAWASEGVLTIAQVDPTLRIDVRRLHQVRLLVEDLRQAGRSRGLLDEVHRRLSDQALLDRLDLAESLAQMNRGEGRVVRRV
ncbi:MULTISPECIES: hypothetical protein [unclassified Crossiella]|uniref:hypothetical protein n=1 Tax=unclassified Crossiella TaxID=2620835 RepID=UPI001FFFC1F4|nr:MULTISPECIES: hypothetical protein [unclassified Crossiella]MCK2237575.1 hypothetical protein [Crossiella sp. S99.2]MCK2254861.1 hypothetical protein [Crossiella sp. S99.1]